MPLQELSEELSLSAGSISLRLALVAFLVLMNAFFVAAEYSMVAVRRSKIDQLASEGDRSAAAVQRALNDLGRFISATQLGVTLASLAIGWIGEPALAVLLDRSLALFGIHLTSRAASSAAAVAVAFAIITFLHIVFGELAPKSIALSKAEGTSRMLVRPLMLFSKLTSPFISILNVSANRLLRVLRVPLAEQGAGEVHSVDELRLLVMQARAHGTLNENDTAMLAGVFDFHNKKAHDIMRPRTEMAAIEVNVALTELIAILKRERYSRYPVYRETADDVVGVFLAKDYWLYDGAAPFVMKDHLREALFIPATRAAERVLDDLRKTREHLAVVLDEYGGTAGIITMEDLVEEVVGDIADEYDLYSRDAMLTDGVLELAGSMSLVDVRSDHRLAIPEGEWSTLGGFVFGSFGRLPKIGDRVSYPGGDLEVVAMDGRRVAALRVHRRVAPSTDLRATS